MKQWRKGGGVGICFFSRIPQANNKVSWERKMFRQKVTCCHFRNVCNGATISPSYFTYRQLCQYRVKLRNISWNWENLMGDAKSFKYVWTCWHIRFLETEEPTKNNKMTIYNIIPWKRMLEQVLKPILNSNYLQPGIIDSLDSSRMISGGHCLLHLR